MDTLFGNCSGRKIADKIKEYFDSKNIKLYNKKNQSEKNQSEKDYIENINKYLKFKYIYLFFQFIYNHQAEIKKKFNKEIEENKEMSNVHRKSYIDIFFNNFSSFGIKEIDRLKYLSDPSLENLENLLNLKD